MAKIAQLNKAQKLALRGNVDATYNELLPLAAKGDVGVNVSLSEIAAYRGNWPEVIERIELLFGEPDSMMTLNAYQDMAQLLARAGDELKKWDEVVRIAKFGKTKLSRQKGDDARFDTIRLLIRYAERKGKASFFPEPESEARRKKDYEAALKSTKDEVFDTPQERLNDLFASAYTADYEPGAIDTYDREKALPDSFKMVAFLASGLARQGREQDAWRVIRNGVKYWRPVEVAQVLPVVLLVDDAIRPLMTPNRCAEVMRIAKGPMAEE